MNPRTRPSGFTITELLVVIAIIALLAAVAVPALRASLESINRSLADTQLRVAVANARDAAVRNAGRGDAAAVFAFEPGGRTRIFICLYAGTIEDAIVPGSGITQPRDIFVPDPASEPVALPPGWSVRAYLPAFTLPDNADSDGWYGENYSAGDLWREGNWIFPETGFFDPTEADEGAKRSSFMIRFRSGTGEVAYERTDEALVLLPVEPGRDASGRLVDFRTGLFEDFNALEALDLRRFVVQVLSDAVLTDDQRRSLIGVESTDTVLVRPITQVGLYREQDLATALGLPLDRRTRSLYTLDPDNPRPELVDGVEPEAINAWMVGRPEGPDPEDEEERASRVFALQLISGSLREVGR